ncbi:hypothetical protein FJZ33_11755 [Candidatus Poribacteria bacterium]|nr:hypothetical protein [Candidatus Poribacteria bacterium]
MKKSKRKKSNQIRHQRKSSYIYRCIQCGCKEDIPKDVVDFFDIMDPGDSNVPPRFRYEKCVGVMIPCESCA